MKRDLMGKKQLGGKDEENGKLEFWLKGVARMETTAARLASQVQYCREVMKWIETLHSGNSKVEVGLKSLLSASSKLSILQKQAIFSSNKSTTPPQAQAPPKTCSISKHLTSILKPKKERRQKIAELKQKKQALHKQIEQILTKQQPYIYEKIIKKVHKQVARQRKIGTIGLLEEVCRSKKNWSSVAQEEVKQNLDQRAIEQRLANNLQKMKQIMTKKVLNNEYIQQVLGNKQVVDRNSQKINKVCADAIDIFTQQLTKLADHNIETELEEITEDKQANMRDVELDQQFFDELEELFQEGGRVLAMPLGSTKTEALLQECQNLSSRITKLSHKKY